MASTLYVEKIELPTSSSETNISLKSGLTVLTVGNDALINDAKTVGVISLIENVVLMVIFQMEFLSYILLFFYTFYIVL